jgi:hypothetical protein
MSIMKKLAIVLCITLSVISCQTYRANDGLYLAFPDFPFYLKSDEDIVGFLQFHLESGERLPIVLMQEQVLFDYIRRCNELKDTIAVYRTWVQTTGQHIWGFEKYIPPNFPDFQPYLTDNRATLFEKDPRTARRTIAGKELAYLDEATWEHVKEISRYSYELRYVYNRWNHQ